MHDGLFYMVTSGTEVILGQYSLSYFKINCVQLWLPQPQSVVPTGIWGH